MGAFSTTGGPTGAGGGTGTGTVAGRGAAQAAIARADRRTDVLMNRVVIMAGRSSLLQMLADVIPHRSKHRRSDSGESALRHLYSRECRVRHRLPFCASRSAARL